MDLASFTVHSHTHTHSMADMNAVFAAIQTLIHADHEQCHGIAGLEQRLLLLEQQMQALNAPQAVSSRAAMRKLVWAIGDACSTRTQADTVSRLSVHIMYEAEPYEGAADIRVYTICFPEESDKIVGSWQQLHLHADILPFAVPGNVADSGEPYPVCVQWDSLAELKAQALHVLRGAEGWTIKIIALETVYGIKSNVYER